MQPIPLMMEDSCSTSEEYEIIGSEASSPTLTTNMSSAPESGITLPPQNDSPENAKSAEPTLAIANNGNIEDLENQLQEVMKEKSLSPSPTNSETDKENSPKNVSCRGDPPSCLQERVETETSTGKDNPIVSSRVQPLSCPQERSRTETPTGKDNPNYNESTADNSTEYNTEEGASTGDYTIFNQILFLGAASINAPRSKNEIHKIMAILNSQTQAQLIEVSVSIPSNSEGFFIVYDATTDSEMVRFEIHNIIYCTYGLAGTSESCCFAFTSSHRLSEPSTLFQCHVFRCRIPEAVTRVVDTLVSAFHRIAPQQLAPQNEPPQSGHREFQFDISLEIKEDDGKSNFTVVPRDKEGFKLRSNIEKQITFTVMPTQPSDNVQVEPSGTLTIERCFGLLVAHGKNVKHADMNLLEMVSMGNSNGERRGYVTCGIWNPSDPVFLSLNKETPKDSRIFMTVAIDLVIRGIQEPVRFIIETKVRVFPQGERFWYYYKKSLTHLFILKLKQVKTSPQGDPQYVVVSVDNTGEVERLRPSTLSLSLNLPSLTSSTLSSISASARSPSIASIETPGADEDTDDDEPLLSGSGEVSKECPEKELEMWQPVLLKWQMNQTPTSKTLISLVKKGIPEALRGEVWQLLAGTLNNTEMMENYRIFITKECHCEQMILRDINRTFPAHEFFKKSGGVGQDALYKISRAYSVYDEEVSYCQATSFLSAALLLHMPEEQAFCVLVKIMFEYGLRDLFKDNFEVLHLRFYQLDRLMEEHVPELWTHFQEQGVESHMFASQWFLTLYTAKFPLFMVFLYLDIFLLLGMDFVFQVALALLQMSKKELVNADFEGILKYFRVSLPKKYRNEDVARQMIRLATSIKVKRLKKYEREYFAIKEHEALQEDPRQRLEKESNRLLQDKMRLERENDLLANEYASCKIVLRQNIDELEDRVDYLTKEVKNLEAVQLEAEEEKKRLTLEATQVKEMLKKETEKSDGQSQKNSAIISEYKQICSHLSEKLNSEQASHIRAINEYKLKVAACERCSQLLSPTTDLPRTGSLGNESTSQEQSPQIKELEMELAKTKLALVEAQCKNQDLTHKLNQTLSELHSNKNTWLHKTLTSISSLKERSGSTSGPSNPPQQPSCPSSVPHSSPQHPSQPSKANSPPPQPPTSDSQADSPSVISRESSLEH